jgi:hypothetical protein
VSSSALATSLPSRSAAGQWRIERDRLEARIAEGYEKTRAALRDGSIEKGE